MGSRRIRVSSNALGESREVEVRVYETLDEMWAASTRFNGTDVTGSWGVTQLRYDSTGKRVFSVIVRLCRGYLFTQVVVHEMHHAATAFYGDHLPTRISARKYLNHHNEPFAHLHSDLTERLANRLHDLGYYKEPA